MAIDTAEKRKSAAAVWHTQIPGVTPNAAKDQEWRQQSGWGYSGILAGGVVLVANAVDWIIRTRRRRR